MSFRSIAADPAELQKLADAFDEAWIAINAISPIVPDRQSAQRERLSSILINIWQADPNADLVSLAVQQFHSVDSA